MQFFRTSFIEKKNKKNMKSHKIMTKQTPMDNNEKQSHYLFYNNCLFVRLLVSVFDSDMYHYDDDCSCRNVHSIFMRSQFKS